MKEQIIHFWTRRFMQWQKESLVRCYNVSNPKLRMIKVMFSIMSIEFLELFDWLLGPWPQKCNQLCFDSNGHLCHNLTKNFQIVSEILCLWVEELRYWGHFDHWNLISSSLSQRKHQWQNCFWEILFKGFKWMDWQTRNIMLFVHFFDY